MPANSPLMAWVPPGVKRLATARSSFLPTTAATAALIKQANAQYAAAQAALRAGDLATYARHIQALGKTLAQLKAAH